MRRPGRELGRLLSRRQFRRRNRAQPHHRHARRRDRRLQPVAGRLHRRRSDRLQLAGLELGVRHRNRLPGLDPARHDAPTCCSRRLAYDAKLPWFGTARGRIGYSVGSTLFYATGGVAYGSVKTNVITPAHQRDLHQDQDRLDRGRGHRNPVHPVQPVRAGLDLEDRISLCRPRFGQQHLRQRPRELHQGDRARVPHRHQLSLQPAGGREVLSAPTVRRTQNPGLAAGVFVCAVGGETDALGSKRHRYQPNGRHGRARPGHPRLGSYTASRRGCPRQARA